MKIAKILGILLICAQVEILAEVPFDSEEVEQHLLQLEDDLKSSSLVASWKAAEDSTDIRTAFDLVVQEIAGEILGRQWMHPSNGNWPLVDWSTVSDLETFFEDQRSFIETTNAIAKNDEELARISTLMGAFMTLGSTAEIWFEDWLLDLAKSTNHNSKRLALYSIRGFGEDIAKESGVPRVIDWSKWGAAYDLADNLGKAILIGCISDLAMRTETYTLASMVHLSVFDGDCEDLKAIALDHGTMHMGESVVERWNLISNEHNNPKLRALAEQALSRE